MAPAASEKKRNRVVIPISSSPSSSEPEDDDDDDDESSSSEEDPEDEDYIDSDDVEEEADDGSEEEEDENGHDEPDDADEEVGEDDHAIVDGKPAEEATSNKVVDLLRGGKSLNALKLEECKSYLRKHGLRRSGTKATCIDRILEHWRIGDGNGEKFYPRPSFSIDCTGDVCKGDIILFRQKVYQKFEKVRRGANVIGKRIVAGRVVKESYGADKQQHTFTVEVLWSKGVKALSPLFPLLVKGRNLYRLRTFRQPWRNEAERPKVLAEKHRRGAAARNARAIAKEKAAETGKKRHGKCIDREPAAVKRRKRTKQSTSEKRKQKASRGRTQDGSCKSIKQVVHGRKPGSSEEQVVHRKQAHSYPHENHIQNPMPGRNPSYETYDYRYTARPLHSNSILQTHPNTGTFFHWSSSGASNMAFNRAGYFSHPYSTSSYVFPQSSRHVGQPSDFDRSNHNLPPGRQFYGQRWR